MFEKRNKQIEKNNSNIEKKENVIAYKKLRLCEMVQNKVVAMFKNKFDTEKVKVEFKVNDSQRYVNYPVTPDLIIKYGEYSFRVNHEADMGSISDWYGFRKDNRDDWHDYLTMLGTFASYMKNESAIHGFILTKMKELDKLYEELDVIEKEAKAYEEETVSLKRRNSKGIIESILVEGMRFNYATPTWITNYRNVSTIVIGEKKDKTYLCSVYGARNSELYSSNRWHDIYVKHDDLHSKILNNEESWGVDFKRRFNLELTIG